MLNQITQNTINYLSMGEFSLWFLPVAFLGGILASISPCSIGMLPLIVGYVGGYGDSNKFKTFLQLSSFVLGLSVVLTIIGVVCALSGSVFASVGGA